MAETTAEPAGRRRDERVGRRNVVRQLLGRPELGAVAGAIIVWAFFAITAGDNGFLSERGTASYLEVSAELGIMAVAVALLMIGGEFDLSVGSVIGASSMTIAILTTESGWNIWPAILAAFAVALAIGFVNGMLVVKTGLPSFIITLGALFAVRGATIGLTREITGRTQVPGVDEAGGFGLAEDIFTTEISGEFAISIVWWLGLAAIATWILLRTRFGNWIFGAGGSKEAARNAGVPVDRVKIMLFMTSAGAAALVATIQAVNFTGADVLRGTGREFEVIIAVVIGGTLLTGGYGSAIGAVFGALIFGMTRQGIVFTGVDSDWFKVFLGVTLVLAVLFNAFVRSRAAKAA